MLTTNFKFDFSFFNLKKILPVRKMFVILHRFSREKKQCF